MRDKKQGLVIFDLDETLIHSRHEPLARPPDFIIDPLHVYFRPFAPELIAAASKHFEVAVWSAGSPVYVEAITGLIFPSGVRPLFVWNRDHCRAKFELNFLQTLYLKDLDKTADFGFDLKNTLIIEDDPVKVRDFSKNAIIVSQYFGDDSDCELSELTAFIDELKEHNDFRDVDKDWKKSF